MFLFLVQAFKKIPFLKLSYGMAFLSFKQFCRWGWFVSGFRCIPVCHSGLFPSEMPVAASVPQEHFWGCVCLHSTSHMEKIVEMCLLLSALGALAQRCWATCVPREDAELVHSNIMATAMELFFNH